MTRTQPINYRSFSIEQENDGTFSIFGTCGYISGNFKTIEDAKKDAEWRFQSS